MQPDPSGMTRHSDVIVVCADGKEAAAASLLFPLARVVAASTGMEAFAGRVAATWMVTSAACRCAHVLDEVAIRCHFGTRGEVFILMPDGRMQRRFPAEKVPD